MALRFRHDPPSFKLPSELLTRVVNGSSEFTRYLFGYSVLFTADKITQFKRIQPRPVPASFVAFQRSFFSFVNRCTSAERENAQADYALKPRTGPWARAGVYDKRGNFVSTFSDAAQAEAYAATMATGVDTSSRSDPNFGKSSSSERSPLSATESKGGYPPSASRSSAGPGSYPTSRSGLDQPARPSRHARSASAANYYDENSHSDERRASDDAPSPTKKRTETPDFSKFKGGKPRDGDEVKFKPPLRSSTGGFFDLAALQFEKPVPEVPVMVKRGDYGQVATKVVFGKERGYVVVGPTGCGKSTVALLHLFLKPKTTVLLLEPTQANAANVFHEFKNILPTLVKSIKAPKVPSVSFVAPTTVRPPYTQLMVSTTEKYLEYFRFHGKAFPADYIVLDEFHLPIFHMVKMLETVRTFKLASKYVLVSATAPGIRIEPALPDAVTHIYGKLQVGKLPVQLVDSDLDPRRWASRGDGTVCVCAPSMAVAQKLHKLYRQWKLRSFLVTRDTYVSDYMKAVENYVPNTVFVIEPGVEAGITLSMAVFVSMGATTAIRFDGKVVLEDTQPLDRISAIQRGGRAGRVVPTLYITPVPPDIDPPESSADYYRAQAIIELAAQGADVNKIDSRGIFEVFPRLKSLTVGTARAAVAAGGDVFVSLYRLNAVGEVYVECGGAGKGFASLAATELYLYHYKGGFFVAPIADLATADSTPDSFVIRSHQLQAAQAMVESTPGLAEKFDLDQLVGMVIAKLDVYLDDLFRLLKSVFTGDQPTMFSLMGDKTRAPEVSDFLGSSPEVNKLFTYLTSEPKGVRYVRVVSGNKASHAFHCGKLTLNFSFPKEYTKDGVLNATKVSTKVFSLLKQLLAVEILINGAPSRCVDLTEYRDRVPTTQVWYGTKVRCNL